MIPIQRGWLKKTQDAKRRQERLQALYEQAKARYGMDETPEVAAPAPVVEPEVEALPESDLEIEVVKPETPEPVSPKKASRKT